MIDPVTLLLGAIGIFLAGLWAVALSNLFALKRLSAGSLPAQAPRVSILLPARNEAASIRACVESLLAQEYPDFEVLVLDDESTDGTGAILAGLAARVPRLKVLTGRPLPAGWLGKHWACHQLAGAAGGDLFLFTDADTVHHPRALVDAVAALLNEEAGLVSALPRQTLGTWGERLIVPLIPWSLLCFYPLAAAARLRWPALVMAIGQFMLFRRADYERAGGHAAVRAHAADDIALARRTAAAGSRCRLVDGGGRVSCRMYHDFGSAWEGLSKNLYPAFGYQRLRFLATWLWLGLVFLAPLPLLAARPAAAGLDLLLAAGLWALTARRLRLPAVVAGLYPAIVGLAVVIALRSLALTLRGRAVWKGRLVAAR